jgi:hypothetical protein
LFESDRKARSTQAVGSFTVSGPSYYLVSPAPLQIFRHDPATEKVVKAIMRGSHLFASDRQLIRSVLDALDAIWVREAAGELADSLIELPEGFTILLGSCNEILV